jgi:FAD/FMN-containing dehydrogenase
VDPSTWQRCTIGGMAGNNSCGGKSIRYGLMADNVRAIDAMLADGSRHGEVGDNRADIHADLVATACTARSASARRRRSPRASRASSAASAAIISTR